MQMHNAPHLGEILKELYLDPLNLTVTEIPLDLQVTRKTLSALLNGRAGVSPQMALRLSHRFDTTPEHWLNLQRIYTLWKTKQKTDMNTMRDVRRFFELSSDSQERSFPKFV